MSDFTPAFGKSCCVQVKKQNVGQVQWLVEDSFMSMYFCNTGSNFNFDTVLQRMVKYNIKQYNNSLTLKALCSMVHLSNQFKISNRA